MTLPDVLFHSTLLDARLISSQASCTGALSHAAVTLRLTRAEVGARSPLVTFNHYASRRVVHMIHRTASLCALAYCFITPYPQGNQCEPIVAITLTSRAHTASRRRRFITLHSRCLPLLSHQTNNFPLIAAAAATARMPQKPAAGTATTTAVSHDTLLPTLPFRSRRIRRFPLTNAHTHSHTPLHRHTPQPATILGVHRRPPPSSAPCGRHGVCRRCVVGACSVWQCTAPAGADKRRASCCGGGVGPVRPGVAVW